MQNTILFFSKTFFLVKMVFNLVYDKLYHFWSHHEFVAELKPIIVFAFMIMSTVQNFTKDWMRQVEREKLTNK